MTRIAVRRGWLAIAGPITTIALFLALLGVFVASYRLSRPAITVPPENRQQFARVAILVDGTGSTDPEWNFHLIKRIVQEKIVPAVGIDDLAVAFDVEKDFKPGRNAVFGLGPGEQMPQDPANMQTDLTTAVERPEAHRQVLYDLIRRLPAARADEAKIRTAWGASVGRLGQPPLPGSDICGPLQELGSFLRQGDAEEEWWLFVLSDLDDTTAMKGCSASTALPGAVKIVLIVPFQANGLPRSEIVQRWQAFFGGRELTPISLTAALTAPALLPPNPTAGLERFTIRTWGECARPMLLPALLAVVALCLVASAAAAFWPMAGDRG